MSATVSVAAQCGRRMSANKHTKRSGSAIMACAMKRIEAPIESTMSVQLLHIPVTWEWKRDNGTMKRIEARIESTMSVQLLHIPVSGKILGPKVASIRENDLVTSEVRGSPCLSSTLSAKRRDGAALVSSTFKTSADESGVMTQYRRHGSAKQTTVSVSWAHLDPTERSQDDRFHYLERRGLALKLAHGDHISSFTRHHQIALRDHIGLLRFSSRFHTFQLAVIAPAWSRVGVTGSLASAGFVHDCRIYD